MRAVIGGFPCTLYADPTVVNVLTSGSDAEGHLRASALDGNAIVPHSKGGTASMRESATPRGYRFARMTMRSCCCGGSSGFAFTRSRDR